jgi:hypothetical protein
LTNATHKSFFHLRLVVLTLVVDMDVVVDMDEATKIGGMFGLTSQRPKA